MSDTTRRLFMGRVVVGAASVGAVAGAIQLIGAKPATGSDRALDPDIESAALDVPVVALLRGSTAGDFSVMIGEREVTFTDKALAAHLLRSVAENVQVDRV